MSLSRRAVLAAGLGLAACDGRAKSATPRGEPPPLKSVAGFPVGTCVSAGRLDDPDYVALLTRHFSQLTPEWEMKMEYILQPDGSYRWDAPDRIVAFARQHGIRLYGTTLIWYAQKPDAFVRLDGRKGAFEAAYRDYIAKVAGRYRGAHGWDVINEPTAENGVGLREHLWSRNLGQDEHMLIAFEAAAAADPGAVLFINDYNLETNPTKRMSFMRQIERLLKRGAKLSGIGTQTHIDVDLAPGAAKAAIKDLAGFGLPIHVSELDCSLGRRAVELRSFEDRRQLQAAKVAEVAEAFMALPERQRFAFTVWGLRDQDSWLRQPPNAGDGTDQPLLFDDDGAPKPALWAAEKAFRA